MEVTPHLDWSSVRRPEGGVVLRVWFRQLANDFWGTLLRPRWYHTWIEVVTPDDIGAAAPLAVGIYDKERDEDRRALLMTQRWEYEDAQLAYYDPGYLLVPCPEFNEEDHQRLLALADGETEEDLGPYSFVCAWNDLFEDEDALNCMIWVERFIRSRGGPDDVLARTGLAFGAHLKKTARRSLIFGE